MSNEDVFNSNADYTVTVLGQNTVKQTYSAPITMADVKAIARQAGISQFSCVDENGAVVKAASFPYAGNLKVREYNAAKSDADAESVFTA